VIHRILGSPLGRAVFITLEEKCSPYRLARHSPRKRRLVLMAVATLFICLATDSRAQSHLLDIDNRVSRFELFYAQATAKPIDANLRFALWQKIDGIAAVPPGPAGDAMARRLLDDAWDRYPALLPRLSAITSVAVQTANDAFEGDNELLGTRGERVHSRLILYVGQFDNNAYTIPSMEGNPPTVLMPVENVNLKLALAHELTHSIHLQLAHVHNSFGAPVGETILLEGLAMRTAQRQVPGLPDAAYTEMPGERGWFSNCAAKSAIVIKKIAGDLDRSGADVASKYTFGQGNTGMSREAYCAAWFVVGKLLSSGHSLPELARIPEDKMVAIIRTAIEKY
jgi:Predicted Zn-dependent protease (DUF2268)